MKKVFFPLLIVVVLFTVSLIVSDIPVEYCNADYCIAEGETIVELKL